MIRSAWRALAAVLVTAVIGLLAAGLIAVGTARRMEDGCTWRGGHGPPVRIGWVAYRCELGRGERLVYADVVPAAGTVAVGVWAAGVTGLTWWFLVGAPWDARRGGQRGSRSATTAVSR